MTALASRIRDARASLDSVKSAAAAARSIASAAARDSVEAESVASRCEEAAALLVALANERRGLVAVRIEAIVSSALAAVFGPSLSFRFRFDVQRGGVVAFPEVGYAVPDVDAEPVWRPCKEVGGGVNDVVSFACRVSLLAMAGKSRRPVIIADEPFKHVSAEFRPRVASLLRTLSDVTGFQLVIVSHEPEIASAAHHVVRVGPGGVCVPSAPGTPEPDLE